MANIGSACFVQTPSSCALRVLTNSLILVNGAAIEPDRKYFADKMTMKKVSDTDNDSRKIE
jgi:hypothetical protein